MENNDHTPPKSLEDLDARLRKARSERGDPSRGPLSPGKSLTGLGQAFRIGTEMVAGIGVGVGIGLLLDRWLGTGPWLLILFFFLGSGAGMLNVYRAAAGIGMAPGYGPRDEDGNDKADADD